MSKFFPRFVLLVLLLVAVQPVEAQEFNGTINGRVSDNSGAIIPGVTVSLSGPAIQGARTSLTDESGGYRFTALPPGTSYTLSFELQGFKKLIRENVTVEVGRTFTVNAALEVATVEETVTVTGDSPVVDVQTAKLGTNFDQTMLENLPNARDIWVILASTPGIRVGRFDVGGSTIGSQAGYSAFGMSGQNWVTLDGIVTTEATGAAGFYYDYGAFSEIQVSAVANSAEVPVPGVYVNTVIKTGGNDFKGEVYLDWEDNSFQSTNLTNALRDQGILEGDKFFRYNDFNLNLGGPIKKDKLWWFHSFRDQFSGQITEMLNNNLTPGAKYTSRLTNYTLKLNYQLNPSNQLTMTSQYNKKYVPYRNGNGANAKFYTQEATRRQTGLFYAGKLQLTSTLSSRSTLDLSVNYWGGAGRYYSWVDKTPTLDSSTSARRGSQDQVGGYPKQAHRWNENANLSYFKDNLGGSHELKGGYGAMWEHYEFLYSASPASPGEFGNVTLVYQNGVPNQVRVRDGPANAKNGLWQHFFFLQDKWQIKRRLTLNLGMRFDRYRSYYDEQGKSGTAPFSIKTSVPARTVSVFNNLVPRIALVYDVFGNGKTALKISGSQYAHNTSYTLAEAVNPTSIITSTYSWDGTRPVSPAYIAQLPPSALLSVGGQPNPIEVDPKLTNGYTNEYSFGVEHELMGGLGLSGSYVRKIRHNEWDTINRAYPTSVYEPVQAIDPGKDGVIGTPDDGRLTIYNRNAAARPTDNYMTNFDAGPHATGVEFGVRKRFTDKWQMISGYDWAKSNSPAPNTYDLNSLTYSRNNSTQWTYKLLGTYQLPKGVSVSGTYNAQQGDAHGRSVQFTSATLIGVTSLRQGTQTLTVEPTGTYHRPTVHMANLRLEKSFRITENQQLRGMFDVFNLFNVNTVIGTETTSNTTTDRNGRVVPRFGRATQIINPRIIRIGGRYSF